MMGIPPEKQIRASGRTTPATYIENDQKVELTLKLQREFIPNLS